MKENLTDISVVLDRSGSMSIVRDDTIGGFNEFLKSQKSAPGEAMLTLAQFDDQYDIIHNGVSIQDVPELTDVTFVPRGMTALLDAIGRTITTTGARLAAMKEEDRPGKVIFVILTDGAENKSSEFTRQQINDMISHQKEAYKWDFVFLGANQDAIKAGSSLGISKDWAMSYAHTSKGTQDAFYSVSNNMCSYRSLSGDKTAGFFDDSDRIKQGIAGAK